jgi:hypothetical protein
MGHLKIGEGYGNQWLSKDLSTLAGTTITLQREGEEKIQVEFGLIS